GSLGYDGGLHVAVVAHQVPHYFQQIRERFHTVDEVARGDHAPADKIERPTDMSRRVMEAGLAGDFRIVQKLGVELNLAVVGAATEEVNESATAQRPNGSFPHLRDTYGLDGD